MGSNCLKNVRILLIGDVYVGKTTLIGSLVRGQFSEEVPNRAEVITIPADTTPEGIPTHIVDYCAREQDDTILHDEIARATVICLVYSVVDKDSLKRLTTHWLPLVRSILGEEHKTPVILVGNKVDLANYSTLEGILPIMNEFCEVETHVECSARTLQNISQVLYYAQKAVFHPTLPIYSSADNELTPGAKKALARIFKICDEDNDALLNDRELNQFQEKCFNVPLEPYGLEAVKAIVNRHISDGLLDDKLTLKGFLFLHKLFIRKGSHETTWAVLRWFGYDNNLQLTNEFIAPRLHVEPGSTAELTIQGYQFLTDIFNKYDEDADGCLRPVELKNLFSTCPFIPWGVDVNNTVVTNHDGWITRPGYLAQWTLTTLLDVPRTLEFLAYLGYHFQHESQLSAVHVTQDKKIDLEKRQTTRNVFRCHVFGAKGVGKTTFLQGLLNRNLHYVSTINRQHFSNFTINTVQVNGHEKYLLLHEVNMSVTDVLTPTDLDCDVACLLYDVTDPRSFNFCVRLYLKRFTDAKMPVLLVACKAEHPRVIQECGWTPAQFCQRYRLPPPQHFTCIDAVSSNVYVKLATMAAYQEVTDLVPNGNRRYIQIGLGVAAVAMLSFALYRIARSNV